MNELRSYPKQRHASDCRCADCIAQENGIVRAKPVMSVWVPDNNPHQARRIGKTAEEVAELGSVLARISIQGLESIDPSSGKTNRQRLLEETADAVAQCECNMASLFTEQECAFIHTRISEKKRQMHEWEAHYKT